MIQRIQTVWMLLAACIASLLLLNGMTGKVFHGMNTANTAQIALSVRGHFPSLIVAVLMIILPLIAISMFKNRKKQRSMVWISILSCISFITINLMHIDHAKNDANNPITNGAYDLGSILPIIVIVLLILALRGISKDEKLVKSMDRLR